MSQHGRRLPNELVAEIAQTVRIHYLLDQYADRIGEAHSWNTVALMILLEMDEQRRQKRNLAPVVFNCAQSGGGLLQRIFGMRTVLDWYLFWRCRSVWDPYMANKRQVAALNQKVASWIDLLILNPMLAENHHHLTMETLREMLKQQLIKSLPAADHQFDDDNQRHRVESIAVLYGIGHFAENTFRTNDLPPEIRQALVTSGSFHQHDFSVFSHRIRYHLLHGQLLQRFFGRCHAFSLKTRITAILSSLEAAIIALPQSSQYNWDLDV